MYTTKYRKKEDEVVQAETPETTYQTYKPTVKSAEPQQAQPTKAVKTNIPNVVPNAQAVDYSMGQQAAARSFSYNGTKPTYASPYSQQIDLLFNEIQNTPEFSYDPDTDETYQALKGQYINLGQRAMRDTSSQIAAQTGGIASSYAASAGAQAYNQYMNELSGYIPELQQLAYEMYQGDLNKKYQQLNAMNAMEDNAYGKYIDELNNYYTDYNNAYNKFLNEQEQDNYLNELAYQRYLDSLSQQNYEREFEYQKEQDLLNQQRYDNEFEYQKEQDLLNQQRYNDEFEYQKYLNELEQQNYEKDFEYRKSQDDLDRAWDEALTRLQFGDYSGVENLGIDMSNYGTVEEDEEEEDYDPYSKENIGTLIHHFMFDDTYNMPTAGIEYLPNYLRDSYPVSSFVDKLSESVPIEKGMTSARQRSKEDALLEVDEAFRKNLIDSYQYKLIVDEINSIYKNQEER